MATYIIGRGRKRHREVTVAGSARDRQLRASGRKSVEDRADADDESNDDNQE